MPTTQHITIEPDKCGGKPCIRGIRIRVSDVLGLMARGLSAEQVIDQFPDLRQDDVAACLEYAAQRVDLPPAQNA